MANFVDMPSVDPEPGAPAPDRLISGDPKFRTWNVEEAKGGLYAGVWEATPGKWRIVYDEWEFCHILSGVSVISEDGGEAAPSAPATVLCSSPASRAAGKCLKRLARNM